MRTLRAEAPGPAALLLEPQTAAHALEMYPVLCDPAIYRFENRPPPSVAWLLQRFTALESRGPVDGDEAGERWLNWVVRIEATGMATGYVQATVLPGGDALVAYEFGSAWWGRGIAFAAVAAMLDELAGAHGVSQAFAVLKAANERSSKLLRRLGFAGADPLHSIAVGIAADERCCSRTLGRAPIGFR